MKTIVIAPHPDDETLGVGGTLLRRKSEGGSLAWVIVTTMPAEYGWSIEKILQVDGYGSPWHLFVYWRVW